MENKKVRIIIEGSPISKSRHRCGCQGRKPISYDPQVREMIFIKRQMNSIIKKQINSKNKDISMKASELAQVESFDVTFTFLFPTTFSSTYRQKNAKLWGLELYNHKPDLDNLEKFYLDCLTGLVWHDDAQVVVNKSRKYYAENPRVEIEIVAKRELMVDAKTQAVLKIISPHELSEFLQDAHKFLSVPVETIDSMLPQSETKDKETQLTRIAFMLMEFADKHTEKMKKINKIAHGAL